MLCIFSARAGAIPVVELHVELAEVVEVPALQVVAALAAVVEVEVVDSLAVGVLEENRHRDIFLSKFLVV
jgi:hypothetical protein